MVAERTREAREEQKKAAAEYAVIIENSKTKACEAKSPAVTPAPTTENSSSSLSTTQWLGVSSIVITLIGLYYKREELKAVYNKKLAPQNAPQEPAPAEPDPATVAQPIKMGLRKMS